MAVRHFLSLRDLSSHELRRLIERAGELKKLQRGGGRYQPLQNRCLAMLFEKSSTRTRVSFEAAMVQMGGSAIYLSSAETQIGRGEPIEDVARVLSRMVDGVVFRTFEHERLERFAAEAHVPVINALTDRNHPCQLLADIQTYVELRGDLTGRKVAWVGDGNNVCHSYIIAAERLGFTLHVACPEGYEPNRSILEQGGEWMQLTSDSDAAVTGADLVVTDVWTSMGQEREEGERRRKFAPYQVNSALMARAKPDAIFMHCLPAHRGEEVTTSVIDGPQSVVWDEAENRLHAQKALLEFLLC